MKQGSYLNLQHHPTRVRGGVTSLSLDSNMGVACDNYSTARDRNLGKGSPQMYQMELKKKSGYYVLNYYLMGSLR